MRVLVLAYYFPPIGGAGAQRPAQFIRHLPELGWKPIVLTGPGTFVGRWTPYDATLMEGLPAELETLRVPGPEPMPSGRWRSRGERWLLLDRRWDRWWIEGVTECARQAGDVDVVYTVMSPYASAEAAVRLSATLGKPWVADLGDPWALDEMTVYPSGLHRSIEKGRMRRLLGDAAAIVMSTPQAVARVKEEFPELATRPIVAVPNGFTADDFRHPPPPRTDGTFRIVHTGYLHTELGLRQRRNSPLRRIIGGETRGVEILTRSHVYLLEAIERLIARDPALAEKIEVHLAGVFTPEDRKAANRSPVVRVLDYLPHPASVQLVQSADLLFLPMQNLPEGTPSSTVPGKTYEYLASGRPILAAVPDGDIRSVLNLATDVDVCRPDDVDAIGAAVARRIQDGDLSSPRTAGASGEAIRRFDYRELTRHVAGVLDRAVARTRLLRTPPGEPTISAVPVSPAQVAESRARRILWIAYHFPPVGGAGTQRSLKFVRYLPRFGYEIQVLTGPGSASDRWTPSDETLTAEVPPSVMIRRVDRPEPMAPNRWRGRAERWLSVTRTWDRWWIDAVVAAGAQADDVDFIYASMSPYSSAEAALTLSRRLGRPWIADLRDPWAIDEMTMYPSGYHRRRELRRMGRLLATASGIVMTTPEAVRRVRAVFPELAEKPIVSIPNGFDATDFERPAPRRDDGAFRIVHTGYLHTELGRQQQRTSLFRRLIGGSVAGVNILTRSHVYLLQAIDRLLEDNPALEHRVELHLAGVLSVDDQEVAGRSGLVRTHGYVDHEEAIDLMRSADLLFLPMQDVPAGMRSSTVPGKTYEYLASRRPILAAVPEGDTRDILTAAGNAYICDPSDVEAMAEAIEQALTAWSKGHPAPGPAAGVLPRFERQNLAAELAATLAVSVPGVGAELEPDPGGARSAAAEPSLRS